MIYLFALLLIIISACSPKYRVEKIYHPPQDKICVQKCQAEYTVCQDKCEDNYLRCLRDSIDRSQKIYSALQKEYSSRLKNYYREYNLYIREMEEINARLKRLNEELKLFSKICSKYRDKDACKKKDSLNKQIRRLKANQPSPPPKPAIVELDEILKKERAMCSCDCGCKEIYDSCYQSCGGRVEIKRICVENCD
ncbi:hypothetical protein [Persephonella sp.]